MIMLSERFFDGAPREKRIFENAMLRTPKHLAGQIQELWRPIRELNRDFLKKVTESMEYSFRALLYQYQEEQKAQDIHGMLEAAEERVDMGLFGVVRQTE